MPQFLDIELELEKRAEAHFEKYKVIKNELLNNEYIFTLAGFAGGNDHGPNHINRVLEYLNTILAGEPITLLSKIELYVLLCSTIIHDIGMIKGREDHHISSGNLIFSRGYDLVSDDEHIKEFVSRIVSSHSSKSKIEDEFKGYQRKETIGTDVIRPLYLAALLRLADEMDEDFRRAKNRIFQNAFIPKESEIYWLINRRIQSLSVDRENQLIKVVVNYKESDINKFYPFEGSSVNVIAAIFFKLTKLYNELQYCMKFLEDGIVIRDVEILYRDRQGDTISIRLDGNISSIPPKLIDIFRQKKEENDSIDDETQKYQDSVNWFSLSEKEREELHQKNLDFVNDSLEIVNKPNLFGKWNLIATKLGNEYVLSLEFSVYDSRNYPIKIDVMIFPVGKYPLSKPEIDIRQRKIYKLHGWQTLSKKLFSMITQNSWRDKYINLKQKRLYYIAEEIRQNQNPLELFSHQAQELTDNYVDRKWVVVKPDNDFPYLELKVLIDAKEFSIKIIPSTRYPFKIPQVVCKPVLESNFWLGNGELNWDNVVQGEQITKYWASLLHQKNYLEKLLDKIDKIIK